MIEFQDGLYYYNGVMNQLIDKTQYKGNITILKNHIAVPITTIATPHYEEPTVASYHSLYDFNKVNVYPLFLYITNVSLNGSCKFVGWETTMNYHTCNIYLSIVSNTATDTNVYIYKNSVRGNKTDGNFTISVNNISLSPAIVVDISSKLLGAYGVNSQNIICVNQELLCKAVLNTGGFGNQDSSSRITLTLNIEYDMYAVCAANIA